MLIVSEAGRNGANAQDCPDPNDRSLQDANLNCSLGQVHVYTRTAAGEAFELTASLASDEPTAFEMFGTSISISADTSTIAVTNNDKLSGSYLIASRVWIFVSSDDWQRSVKFARLRRRGKPNNHAGCCR